MRRQLQRFGRTGRKRAGCVHVLLAEDREEFNLDKARASYKEVQKSICRGDDLEFYADVERLLPDHNRPTCLEKVMEIRPYIREERGRAKRSPTKASTTKKRKRNDDMMRNIPPGACTGFMNVADLIVKASKRRKAVDTKDLEAEGEDDEVDKALEAGVDGLLSGRRTQSLAPAPSKSDLWDEENVGKSRAKGKTKRAATISSESTAKPKAKAKQKKSLEDGKGKGKAESKGKGKRKEPTPSLSQQGKDDSVDRELERGPFASWKKVKARKESTPPSAISLSPSRSLSPVPLAKYIKTPLSPLKEDMAADSDTKTERRRSKTPCAFFHGISTLGIR